MLLFAVYGCYCFFFFGKSARAQTHSHQVNNNCSKYVVAKLLFWFDLCACRVRWTLDVNQTVFVAVQKIAIYFYSHGCILSLRLFDIDLVYLAAARKKNTFTETENEEKPPTESHTAIQKCGKYNIESEKKIWKKVKLNFQSIFHTEPHTYTHQMTSWVKNRPTKIWKNGGQILREREALQTSAKNYKSFDYFHLFT